MKILISPETEITHPSVFEGWERDALLLDAYNRRKHHLYDFDTFTVFNGGDVNVYHFTDKRERRNGMMFVALLKEITAPFLPQSQVRMTGFNVWMVRTTDEEAVSMGNIDYAVGIFRDAMSKFCEDNGVFMAFVPHVRQEGMYPHIHFLYGRQDGEENKLRECLLGLASKYPEKVAGEGLEKKDESKS